MNEARIGRLQAIVQWRNQETALANQLAALHSAKTAAELRVWLEENPGMQRVGALQFLVDLADEELDRSPKRALEFMNVVMPFLDGVRFPEQEHGARALFAARAWYIYGHSLRATGEYARAQAAAHAGQKLLLDTPFVTRAAELLALEGAILADAGDPEGALERLREAAAVFQRYDDSKALLKVRITEGAALYQLRRDVAAVTVFQSALQDARDVGDRVEEARILNNLGHLFVRANEHDRAEHYLRHAQRAWSALGKENEATRARWGIARVAQRRGRYTTALLELKDVCAQMAGDGAFVEAAMASLDIGQTLVLSSNPREAKAYVLRAIDVFAPRNLSAETRAALATLRECAAGDAIDLGVLQTARDRLAGEVDAQADEALPADGYQ